MTTITSLAETAMLVGEPTRTAILVMLMDGRALTAGELARTAGITPPTASGHLARLVEAGLLGVVPQGRHRYFRLATPAVAQMLESLMGVAGVVEERRRIKPVVTGPRDRALRYARVCYDHLAGEIAVRLADALVDAGHVDLSPEGAAVTEQGLIFLRAFGLDLDDTSGVKHRQSVFCRPCMDWSERRPHIAGRFGRSLFQACLDRHWLRRVEASRAVTLTPVGLDGLKRHFGIEAPDRTG